MRKQKSLTERVETLLNKEEGLDVDFKRDRNGIKPEDLVAFANSPSGGTILVGVDEDINKEGKQRGKIVGCKISDGEKLALLGKASECRPPIDIEIIIENENTDKPFYRIEIPSGPYKPYCTNRGVYQIRGDARNNPITPEQLLNIFLEKNSSEFFERFKHATLELESNLQESQKELFNLNIILESMNHKVNENLSLLLTDIDSFKIQIENQLEHIFSSAEDASDAANDANSEASDMNNRLSDVEAEMEEIYWLVYGVHEHLNIENPNITKGRILVKRITKQMYSLQSESIEIVKLKDQVLTYIREKRKLKVNPKLIEKWVEEQYFELMK
ncbi:RNA-binding domain-containing protein [Chryseomicrobium palamuruense]|uniref:RNA-binding domain-containing protein n=1 Tax=Chryseomicrobium palamuruense TaxID=682973 RepID=A0ABV8UTV5_9BACL